MKKAERLLRHDVCGTTLSPDVHSGRDIYFYVVSALCCVLLFFATWISIEWILSFRLILERVPKTRPTKSASFRRLEEPALRCISFFIPFSVTLAFRHRVTLHIVWIVGLWHRARCSGCLSRVRPDEPVIHQHPFHIVSRRCPSPCTSRRISFSASSSFRRFSASSHPSCPFALLSSSLLPLPQKAVVVHLFVVHEALYSSIHSKHTIRFIM